MIRWPLSIVCFLTVLPLSRADVMILPPGIERIAQADAVIVGKVVAIEPQDIDVPVAAGSATTFKFRVAVVQVGETILGNKEAKTVRVGFVPRGERNNPIGFGKCPELNFNLEVGKQGLMFLRMHQGGKILYGRLFHDFVSQDTDATAKPPSGRPPALSFAEELKKTRHICKLVESPQESLKAKDPLDRYLAAAALVMRYRTLRVANQKTELISVEETRRILDSLLAQDWKAASLTPTPWNCFLMLGLTEKDGWKAPAQINDINDVRTAVQTWYRAHGQNYRIQRFINEAAK